MTCAEASRESGVVGVSHHGLDLLEFERTLAYIIAGHEWIIDHNSWLEEERVLRVCVLVGVLFCNWLTGHMGANRVLTDIQLSIISQKL